MTANAIISTIAKRPGILAADTIGTYLRIAHGPRT